MRRSLTCRLAAPSPRLVLRRRAPAKNRPLAANRPVVAPGFYRDYENDGAAGSEVILPAHRSTAIVA